MKSYPVLLHHCWGKSNARRHRSQSQHERPRAGAVRDDGGQPAQQTDEGQGKKVYRLGLGQSPFPIPELVVQALRDVAIILIPMVLVLLFVILFPDVILALPRWVMPKFIN